MDEKPTKTKKPRIVKDPRCTIQRVNVMIHEAARKTKLAKYYAVCNQLKGKDWFAGFSQNGKDIIVKTTITGEEYDWLCDLVGGASLRVSKVPDTLAVRPLTRLVPR